MKVFYEIPGLNVYLQIAVTLISIVVHRVVTRGKQRESLIETIGIFTIGLSGWFTFIAGLFGHIL
jgi:hypothetical protein